MEPSKNNRWHSHPDAATLDAHDPSAPVPELPRPGIGFAQTALRGVARAVGARTTPGHAAAAACVELVQGSDASISSVNHDLLRRRLRSAAMVLFLGSAAFLLKSMFLDEPLSSVHPEALTNGPYLIWLHVAHVVVLGTISGMLWFRCERMCTTSLQVSELITFGFTAIFLMAMQHFHTVYRAYAGQGFESPAGMWFSLLFTYAIFIPSSWQRAAMVVGLMCTAPVVQTTLDMLLFPVVAQQLAWDEYTAMIMMMMLGFGTSVYGTYTIGSLRRAAHEARQFGQYRLRHLIGAGGMGEVYLAEHQMLKRPCAIKLIRAGKAHDPRALARFEREVRATATLSHWNTVEIFDYGHTEDGTFYYVMEYLPGLSLVELVERHGPLPPERVLHLITQTCDALREAHSIGLIHRDIKPGNIFAAQRGGVDDVAKLLDFGLAKPLMEEDSLQLTNDGAITGSPLYMSPEQALGDAEPDARSDIYSLGAVAYYLLTGRPPFEGDKPMKVLLAHARDEVVPPSQLVDNVPADLERVILRSLAKSPAERYQNAISMGHALADCSLSGVWTRERAAQWWRQLDRPLALAT